jgi:hypothetical protein
VGQPWFELCFLSHWLQLKELEDVVRHSQAYAGTLQGYNTTLQAELREEKSGRETAGRERDTLQVACECI